MSIVQDPTHPTGVRTEGNDKGGTALTKARIRKAEAALDLKARGYTNDDIAVVLGYPSGKAVGTALELALQGELRETDKVILRGIANRRLEQAVRSLHDKITNPDHPEHLAAVNTYVKVIDRWAKLMGLDAPTEFIVTSPAYAEIQEWVDNALRQQAIAAGVSGNELEEADILDSDAEWVPDDEEGLEPIDDLEPTT